MPKHRQRVCLNDGQRLDINRLIRDGTIPPAMKNEKAGPLRMRYPEFEQEICFRAARGISVAGNGISNVRRQAGFARYSGSRPERHASPVGKPGGVRSHIGRSSWCRQIGLTWQRRRSGRRCVRPKGGRMSRRGLDGCGRPSMRDGKPAMMSRSGSSTRPYWRSGEHGD